MTLWNEAGLPPYPSHAAKRGPSKMTLAKIARSVAGVAGEYELIAFVQKLDGLTPPSEEFSDARIDTCVVLGTPPDYRIELAAEFGSGHLEFCGLADGFYTLVCDLAYTAPYAMLVSMPNMLRVRVATKIEVDFAPAGVDCLSIHKPSVVVEIDPPDSPPTPMVLSGELHQVYVVVHSDFLRRFCATEDPGMAAVIRDFLAGKLERRFVQRLPLSGGFMRCFEEMQNCTLKGNSRRLLIQAKAIEILSHLLQALAQSEAMYGASATSIRGVLKAKKLLETSFAAPPTLDDIAQEVGLSRTVLSREFRQIIGLTVFDYISALRMEHALDMLNAQQASISEIARTVGFTHASSFTAAFQRRFGTSPREMRLRHSIR